MKYTCLTIAVLLTSILITGCGTRGSSGKDASVETEADTVSVPDTGYTGIKKYYSGDRLVKEVTFRNSIRHGEMKSYYPGGQLYQSFWYENGLREDSARWYYTEGQVFRSTPYRHDTADGIQVQYYRTGRIKARIQFINGLRAPFMEEFSSDGKLVKGYPEISFSLVDNYSSSGRVRVNLELSNKAAKVKFYRGEFTNGVFDTTKCVGIKTFNGKASLDLIKKESTRQDYIGIIAEVITDFGNKYLTYKKIDLPYKDLE